MLVLSRRSSEKLVFPTLGITVEVLGLKGQSVRLGITAPPEVRVLRAELAAEPAPASPPASASPPTSSLSHALCNRLNKISLGLQLLQRQWQAGQAEQAQATVDKLLLALEELQPEWVAAHGLAQPAPRSPFRTLVVEDDSNERELLAGLLRLHGCDCETAADGLAALEYLDSHERPDLILLDLRMPRCDGPQMLAQIRGNPRYAGLKVFAISGTPPDALGICTGPDGIDAWFPKPLQAAKLWEAIQREQASPSRVN